MLTLHHLDHSRSTRILWLLEEVGIPYELRRWERTPEQRAPAGLRDVHPLGKSPTLVDGDLVLAESSAILRYLNTRYADGRFAPPVGGNDHALHDEWLDFVEGTLAMPVIVAYLAKRMGDDATAVTQAATAPLDRMIVYLADTVGKTPFLMGDAPMLADMQMVYILELARLVGALDGQPAVAAYLDRLKAQPGFRRAIEKGGVMSPEDAQ